MLGDEKYLETMENVMTILNGYKMGAKACGHNKLFLQSNSIRMLADTMTTLGTD